MVPDICVIIAAYNSDPDGLNRMITSLDTQTLPKERWEVRFVDDGSSDETLPRLQQYSASRPHMHVESIPNSGWPSRPRNVATRSTTARYVFYADHDDYMFPEALERMLALADETHADMVHPKEVVEGWSSPGWRSWPYQGLADDLDPEIFQCITPHKLYRRDFLVEHQIEFMDGKVRLEDFDFNGKCWAAGAKIAVLADYPCYKWIIGNDNSHKSSYDEDNYWACFLRSLHPLLSMDEGHLKDILLIRWYNSRVVGRLAGGFARRSAASQDSWVKRLHEIQKQFPERLDSLLPPTDRGRAVLLRASDTEALAALAQENNGVRLASDPAVLGWNNGKLTLKVNGRYVSHSGEPLLFKRDDFATVRAYGTDIDLGAATEIDYTDAISSASAEFVVRARNTMADWVFPATVKLQLTPHGSEFRLDYVLEGSINVDDNGFGIPFENNVFDVFHRINGLGLTATHRVPLSGTGESAAVVGSRPVAAYSTKANFLALDLVDRVRNIFDIARPLPGQIETTTTGVFIPLSGLHVNKDSNLHCVLKSGVSRTPANIHESGGRAVLTVAMHLPPSRNYTLITGGERAGARLRLEREPNLYPGPHSAVSGANVAASSRLGRGRAKTVLHVAKEHLPQPLLDNVRDRLQHPAQHGLFNRLRGVLPATKKRALLIGAFERDNFGDLLFLEVTSRLMPKTEVVAAAPVGADMSAEFGRAIRPYAHELRSSTFDVVWTVGGEIGRVNTDLALRYAAPPHITEILNTLPRRERGDVYEYLAGAPRMPLVYVPPVADFPLNKDSYQVIHSAGLSGLDRLEKESVQKSLERLERVDRISVRDKSSKRMLAKLGIKSTLSPDVVHSLPLLLPEVLGETEDFICFHPSTEYVEAAGLSEVARTLAALARRTGYGIRLFVAGTAVGHDSYELYDRLAAQIPGVDIVISDERNPVALAKQVARSRIWIGTSLHGRIIAASAGVPRMSLSKKAFASDRTEKTARYSATWDPEMPYAVTLPGIDDAYTEAMSVESARRLQATADRLTKMAFESARSVLSSVGLR